MYIYSLTLQVPERRNYKFPMHITLLREVIRARHGCCITMFAWMARTTDRAVCPSILWEDAMIRVGGGVLWLGSWIKPG